MTCANTSLGKKYKVLVFAIITEISDCNCDFIYVDIYIYIYICIAFMYKFYEIDV